MKNIADELIYTWSALKCGEDGIQLQLDSSVKYDQSRLEQGWFKSSVNISSLIMDTLLIDEICAQAFRGNSFAQSLTELTLQNLHVRQLVPGTFTGLNSLQSLILQPLISTDYTPDFFTGIQNTLKHLTFLNVYITKPVQIEGITGGNNTLPKLITARFQTNLKDTITNATFLAIPNLQKLILSHCHIEVLGTNSFAPLHRLRYLNLNDNAIKTIPYNILQPFIAATDLHIELQDNQWHCDCSLLYLQEELLQNSSIFEEPMVCSSPPSLQGELITSVTLCDIDTTTALPFSTERPQYLNCPPFEEFLAIRRPQYRLYIAINSVGDVITSNLQTRSIVLLWFHLFPVGLIGQTDPLACHIGSPYGVHVQNLQSNVAYTFCQMNRTEMTLSPLDCMSYHHKQALLPSAVWLYAEDKEAYIGYFVVSLIGCATIGALFGYICCRTIWWFRKRGKITTKSDFINDGVSGWTKYSADRISNTPSMETIEYVLFIILTNLVPIKYIRKIL